MSQSGDFYETVRQALDKDGWTITAAPFVVEYEDLRLFADFGAAKGARSIVVEVGRFNGPSFIGDFHKITGWYYNCRSLMFEAAPESRIYLAVSRQQWEGKFQRPAIQVIIANQKICFLIFDPLTQMIVKWVE